MDEVKILGNNETASNEAKKAVVAEKEEQKEAGRTVEGPTVGITQDGYLFIKVHLSEGYLGLQGFIRECHDWLEHNHKDSFKNVRKAEAAKKEKKLIKPGGRFNLGLFKGK